MIDVAFIDIGRRLAELTDGTVVPITNLFDRFGDETDDWSEADRFVCGAGNMWLACPVENFTAPTFH